MLIRVLQTYFFQAYLPHSFVPHLHEYEKEN